MSWRVLFNFGGMIALVTSDLLLDTLSWSLETMHVVLVDATHGRRNLQRDSVSSMNQVAALAHGMYALLLLLFA